MKVLICTGIYPPDIGGPATYSKLLFDELPKKEIEVKVLSFGEVRHLPKLVRHYVYYQKVKKMGVDVDLIYVQDPVSVGLPTAFASKKIKKKFILKIVGDYAWEQYQQNLIFNSSLERKKFIYPEEFWNKKFDFKTELLKKIEKFVAKRATIIIVPSNYLKNIVAGWGIDKEKIKVIYNSFIPFNIVEEKYSLRIRFKISGVTIFSAGRFVPWKGFETLIDVIKDLPEIKLYIVGDGPEYFKLKTKIENLKLKNRVFLLGRLKQDDLLKQIKASDIFILNTGYEGFSHQLLEVMSIGTPIITTNVGGNPELIRNGREGLLVNYNDKKEIKDAILKLSKDRILADKLVKNAKERVNIFNKKKMIQQIIDTLKILVN